MTCSKKHLLVAVTAANQVPKMKITNTKLYVSVLTLPRKNWNKYQSKKTPQVQNRYLDVVVDPSFQGVNILFVISFKHDDGRKSYKQYYLPIVEIKYYNFVIDERNVFDKPIRNDLKTY